jgi:hypothetical protein
MSLVPRIARLFRNLTRRRGVDQNLADEVRSHVDLATQQKMKEGLNETDARRTALVELGGDGQIKEQVVILSHAFWREKFGSASARRVSKWPSHGHDVRSTLLGKAPKARTSRIWAAGSVA